MGVIISCVSNICGVIRDWLLKNEVTIKFDDDQFRMLYNQLGIIIGKLSTESVLTTEVESTNQDNDDEES